MTETTRAINALMHDGRAANPASTRPSRVERATDDALQRKGITSVIDHRDPGFFRTRILTLFPPLSELHEAGDFPYPDLDSLLEAHLKNRWGAAWDTFTPEEKLEFKRGLAGSARNWDDLIYQVVMENVDAIKGLTPEQRKRLKNLPLIREEFCHNSPLNGKSYLDADGSRIDLTHAGSCTEDRESGNIHLFRRIGYQETRETLYYTGRPETSAKAIEQGSWMFLKELDATGKGITRNADGTYTLNYLVDSMLDSTRGAEFVDADHYGSVRAKLREEIATLRALRGAGPINVTAPDGTVYRVNLKPILVQQQYNINATVEKFTPTWLSGKEFSDDIIAEGLPQLQALAQEVRQNLQAQYPKTSLNGQKDLLKRIKYLDLALNKLKNYGSLTRRERAFYMALLCRMLNIPFVIHCKSSKDRTGGLGKLVCALYTWLDAGMPDDFSRIIGKGSGKDDPLRNLFDELIIGNLMAAQQVTGYGLGATGVVDGEQLEAGRRGLDVGEAPPIVDRLPERYTKPWHPAAIAAWLLIAAPILCAVSMVVELVAIVAMFLEWALTVSCILPFIYLVTGGTESAKRNLFYVTRHVGPNIPKDLFIRPFYIFKLCFKRKFDKDSPCITNRGFVKSKERKIKMTAANQAMVRQVEAIPEATCHDMIAYLYQDAPELAVDTPHRDVLITLGRVMPTLSRIANRPDFSASLRAKTRALITAFEVSRKTVWNELEYLPDIEFEHLVRFINSENRGPETVLSPREKRIFKELTRSDDVVTRQPNTAREATLLKTYAQSSCGTFSLSRIPVLEDAVYDPIIAYLRAPNGDLSALSTHQQKILLFILGTLNGLRQRVGDANPHPRLVQVATACTQEKVVITLLKQIDQLPEKEYQALVQYLQAPGTRLPLLSATLLDLLREHTNDIFSLALALHLTPKQSRVLEELAASASKDLFSLNHIEFLEQAKYERLIAHFASPNPKIEDLSAQDQQLLKFILAGATELFEKSLEARLHLPEKQLRFLQALAETPYGTFTYPRGEFLTKNPSALSRAALIALVRDIDIIKYEAKNYPVQPGHFLHHANDNTIKELIEGWIDELPEAEHRQLLEALRQAEPASDQFSAQHKQLLLAIANHIRLLQPPYGNDQRRDLIEACKNAHLFIFQFPKLMSAASMNVTAVVSTAGETICDTGYRSSPSEHVMSLDGARTYDITDQLRKDLMRSNGIEFYRDDQLIPNAGHNRFILSPEIANSPRGLQFFGQLNQWLQEKGVGQLYDTLGWALQNVPYTTLRELITKQELATELHAQGLDYLIAPLQEAFAIVRPAELRELLCSLQERLMLDLLFDGLKELPALAGMEQFPLYLQACLNQAGRNYFMDHIIGGHVWKGATSEALELIPQPGSTWRIRFRSADASSITAQYETDCTFSAHSADSFRRCAEFVQTHFSYELRLRKPVDSNFWRSEFHIGAAAQFTSTTPSPDDIDLLFAHFTRPTDEAIFPTGEKIEFLQDCISKTNAMLPTFEPEAQPYFQRRIEELLQLLQPLMAPADYQAFADALPQQRAESIKKAISSRQREIDALTLDNLNKYEAFLNNLLPQLQALIPDPEFQQISAEARAAIIPRRASLAAAAQPIRDNIRGLQDRVERMALEELDPCAAQFDGLLRQLQALIPAAELQQISDQARAAIALRREGLAAEAAFLDELL